MLFKNLSYTKNFFRTSSPPLSYQAFSSSNLYCQVFIHIADYIAWTVISCHFFFSAWPKLCLYFVLAISAMDYGSMYPWAKK